jgi:hypothetical protein
MKNYLKKLILFSLIFSIIFYILGIITGIIFGNEIIKVLEKRNENITMLINEIRRFNEELERIKILLLSQEKCKIIKNFLEEEEKLLQKFYSILPYRLEEFEFEEVPNWYLELKKEYMKLELNTWVIAKEYESCKEDFITILYFYKPKCFKCIKQGKELDKIRDYLQKEYEVKIFTVDINLSNSILSIIKKIYNINDAPSFIFKNITFSNFTSFDEFLSFFQSLEKK